MDSIELKLRKFDMSSIDDNKVVVLLGKRDTGKSFLVRDLMYYHRGIPLGTVVSATESANHFYSSIVPSMFIHEKPDPKIVTNALLRQRILKKKIRREIKHKGRTDADPRAFLILDDCLAEGKKWINHEDVRAAFMNGRHFDLLFVVTLQYPMGLPPVLRGNIDYVFVLRDNITANRRRIYENYCGMFPSFEMFCNVLDQTTSDYECLVIHNNAKSNKLEDQIFWYKAQRHDDFRVGDSYFWAQSQADDDDDDGLPDEALVDSLANMRVRNKGPFVSVVKSP